MADVTVVRKIDDESIDILPQLTQVAIDRAFARARGRIEAYAKDITPVSAGYKHPSLGPHGRLRDSIQVGTTPMFIAIKWSAPYAEVADEGRPGGVPIVAHTSGTHE
jgi:hypothetical protein